MTERRFRGVSRHKNRGGRWVAYCYEGGRQRYLGMFDTAEEAAEARDLASLRRHGLGAVLNFPERRAAYEERLRLSEAEMPAPVVEDGVACVPLTGKHAAGRVFIVDAEDLPLVEPHPWYAHLSPKAGRVYPRTRVGGHKVRAAHLITGADSRTERVTYRNGDSLDLRRANLKVVPKLREAV